MPNQNQQEQNREQVSREGGGPTGDEPTDGLGVGSMPESQHNDWGHRQAGDAGNAQSAPSDQSGNVGGMPGSQHNDWGHSPVPTEDSQGGNRQSSDGAGKPRQGVMPGEEMGHLQHGHDSKSQP